MKKEITFKIGDRVRAKDDYLTIQGVQHGKIYTVRDIHYSLTNWMMDWIEIRDKGACVGRYHSYLFQKAGRPRMG